jgi:hypothetical protein
LRDGMYVVDFIVAPMHAFTSWVPSVRNSRSPCSLHAKIHEISTERSLPNASTRLDILEEFWQEPARQWGCIRMSHAGTGPAWEVACASACASAAACTEEVASMDFPRGLIFLAPAPRLSRRWAHANRKDFAVCMHMRLIVTWGRSDPPAGA